MQTFKASYSRCPLSCCPSSWSLCGSWWTIRAHILGNYRLSMTPWKQCSTWATCCDLSRWVLASWAAAYQSAVPVDVPAATALAAIALTSLSMLLTSMPVNSSRSAHVHVWSRTWCCSLTFTGCSNLGVCPAARCWWAQRHPCKAASSGKSLRKPGACTMMGWPMMPFCGHHRWVCSQWWNNFGCTGCNSACMEQLHDSST